MLKKIIHKILTTANDLARDFNGEEKKISSPTGLKKENLSLTAGKKDFQEEARQESMKTSQGKSDFSGSGYNGPGNVDHEKRNSNMGQRNF